MGRSSLEKVAVVSLSVEAVLGIDCCEYVLRLLYATLKGVGSLL
jgi:hypothetical protein